MEKIPDQIPPEKKSSEDINFHEVGERRAELRRAIAELGGKGPIIEKHYKKPLEEANRQASGFSIKEMGGLEMAKKVLREQKTKYEKEKDENVVAVDYEAIYKTTPELEGILSQNENISDLKDFRMRRMFELLNPQTTLATRKRNEAVLQTVRGEIALAEEKLAETELLTLRQAEILGYKENLAHSGHICLLLL